MRYFLLVVLLAGLVLTAAGCSVKYKGVGIYPNSGEIFNCDIDHDLLMGQAQVTASNNAGVVCRGTSKVTYAPMLSICDGQRGIIDMTCSDGRRIVLDWEAESCTSGFGMGVDQSGRPVMIAFGGDEATLQSRALSLGGQGPGR